MQKRKDETPRSKGSRWSKPPSLTAKSHMDVYWLEQIEADVPAESDWLSPTEAAVLNGLRFAKRRADWRLGRWTAKRTVAFLFGIPTGPHVLSKIEIRPAPSGVPEVHIAKKRADLTISLSHRAGTAVCAVTRSGVALGCDLELVEPRSEAFVADYFTAEEQAMVGRASTRAQSRLLALLWSAKESALKALHTGLRLDTRSVMVAPVEFDLNGWSQLRVHSIGGRVFHGWWQQTNGTIRTLVAALHPTRRFS